MATLTLPLTGGGTERWTTGEPLALPVTGERPDDRRFDRIAYAAAHVVTDPLADYDPFLEPAIDWERTIAFREHLWDLGLGVAEAMDTAQRGMGLGWPEAQDLIARSLGAAKSRTDALIACGAGTDHLDPGPDVSLDDVIRAYEEQVGFVEGKGGRIILMASRALAAAAKGPDDYTRIYDRILSQVREPVIIHWLGEMFDPALEGYWGKADHNAAMDVCLDVLAAHADRIDGIKISLLSKEKEIAMRRRLPANDKGGVRMYTGDDFNYAELIAGDEQGHSDALLGIFDAIAPAASAALTAHGAGDVARFHEILAPTVPLSRHIFAAPTRFYKTGVVFTALSQRFAGPFHDGRRAGRRAFHAASGGAVPAGGQGRHSAEPG